LQTNQILRECSHPIVVTAGPTKVHPHIAAIGPTPVCKRVSERRVAKLPLRIVFVERQEHANSLHAVALLRLRHHRPRCRAPQSRNELSPFH
jgi:hypothetical protein